MIALYGNAQDSKKISLLLNFDREAVVHCHMCSFIPLKSDTEGLIGLFKQSDPLLCLDFLPFSDKFSMTIPQME